MTDPEARPAVASPHGGYLDGLYAPLDGEREALDLPVTGRLPDELAGSYVRNGPNPRFAPTGRYHWFDGDGMVHGVALGGGRASYVRRWVRTRDFEQEGAAGAPLWGGILDPIVAGRAPEKDTANTDLVCHAGRLIATWWLAGVPIELGVPGLETLGEASFGRPPGSTMGPHPKVDPRTGELVFHDMAIRERPWLRYGVIGADGRVRVDEPIEVSGPRIFHDLALTERYTVLIDVPMQWDPRALEAGKRRIQFDADAPTRFGVLPRHGGNGDVRWFETPPCYIFHAVNAHEDGDSVVLTAFRCENPIPEDPRRWDGRTPRLFFLELAPTLHRWRLDLADGSVRMEQLDDSWAEFPRINDDFLGVESRYAYVPRVAQGATLHFDALLKYDLADGSVEAHELGPERVADEPVFVPRPGALAEDDGWLVGFQHARDRSASELVVLDARDPRAAPLAHVHLPEPIPVGFHAAWVPGGHPERSDP